MNEDRNLCHIILILRRFKELNNVVNYHTDEDIQFKEIHCDYETAIINSIRKIFKKNSSGCWFHFSGALKINCLKIIPKIDLQEESILFSYKYFL